MPKTRQSDEDSPGGRLRLRRNVQCKKCPWKKSTNAHKIPNGYSVEQHQALKCTIGGGNHSMACHESEIGDEYHCVGWLANQLGPGNNIDLRLRMSHYDLTKVRTVGEQHERFEDTLPKGD